VTRGARIAIGCLGAGCLVTAGAAAAVVFGIGVGAQWLKTKAQGFVSQQEQVEAYKKQANAVPFTRPADGAITEDRLLKFLEIRRRVSSVYEKHRPQFEAIKDKKDADFSDLRNAFGMLGDVRLALAQAMAEVGMSEEEYLYLVQAVYHSAWSAAVEKDSGKPASEAMGEMMRQAEEALRKSVESARKDGVPGVKDVPDSAVTSAQDQMERAAEAMKAIDAPKANIELFRKHEAEIKSYTMHGLELLGL
jgi:hypothetical protein